MINGSNIRLPNGQFSTLVTPVNKDGVTQLITPVDANGNVITGGGSSDPSQITSETAPTTRVNPSTGLPSGGDPLQIGDRWYKPSMGQEGFWNGTLWLTQRDTVVARSGLNSAFSATNTTYILGAQTNLVSRPTDLLFLRKLIYTFTGGTFTADNRWEIFDRGCEVSNRGGSPTSQIVTPSSTTTAIINNQARVFSVEQEYNIVLPLASGATEAIINEYRLSLTKFGVAANINLTGVIMEFSRVMS